MGVGERSAAHGDEVEAVGHRLLHGRAPIDELEAKLSASLALPDHEDEFDTAAGLAVALAGRLPQRGEILHHPAGFDVEVTDADPRRVKRMRIKPSADAVKPSAEPPAERKASIGG